MATPTCGRTRPKGAGSASRYGERSTRCFNRAITSLTLVAERETTLSISVAAVSSSGYRLLSRDGRDRRRPRGSCAAHGDRRAERVTGDLRWRPIQLWRLQLCRGSQTAARELGAVDPSGGTLALCVMSRICWPEVDGRYPPFPLVRGNPAFGRPGSLARSRCALSQRRHRIETRPRALRFDLQCAASPSAGGDHNCCLWRSSAHEFGLCRQRVSRRLWSHPLCRGPRIGREPHTTARCRLPT